MIEADAAFVALSWIENLAEIMRSGEDAAEGSLELLVKNLNSLSLYLTGGTLTMPLARLEAFMIMGAELEAECGDCVIFVNADMDARGHAVCFCGLGEPLERWCELIKLGS
jgi:hypothetical protein